MMELVDILEGKPIIEYPTRWSFTLIGWQEKAMRGAVRRILGDVDYDLHFSHFSTKGTYCSLNLEMVVASEEVRLGTYELLKEADEIRMII